MTRPLYDKLHQQAQKQAMAPWFVPLKRSYGRNTTSKNQSDSIRDEQVHLLALAARTGQNHIIEDLCAHGVHLDGLNGQGMTALMVAAQAGNLETVKCLVSFGAGLDIKSKKHYKAIHYAACQGCLDILEFLIQKGADPFEKAEEHHLNKQNAFELAGVPDFFIEAARIGDMAAVKFCLENLRLPINTSNKQGMTALMAAASSGNRKIVAYLLDSKAALTQIHQSGMSAIHFAAEQGHMHTFGLLVARGADPNQMVSHPKRGKCHAYDLAGLTRQASQFAYIGDIAALESLVDNYSLPMDVQDCKGKTLLMIASEAGKHAMVKRLIAYGADIHQAMKSGWTAIHFAAKHGHLEIMSDLIRHGADVSARVEDQFSRKNVFELASIAEKLLLNASQGHLEALIRLYDALDLPIDMSSNDGFTPLMAASKAGYLEMIKVLIKRGANINAQTFQGEKPIHFAASSGHIEIMGCLIKHGAKLEEVVLRGPLKGKNALVIGQICQRITNYARSGGIEQLDYLMKSLKLKVDLFDEHGKTPLMIAAEAGKVETVKFLLEKGANIHAKSKFQKTALDYAKASHIKDNAVVEYLRVLSA